ncbi:MAG TPA: hypothetical protein DD656_04680, partial [Alphaproteobacteria bacterium]|nr:hypothetical protein [Alphaproteobacteria bacterium]
IDPWFLEQFEQIIHAEQLLVEGGFPANPDDLQTIKSLGFSDARIANLCNLTEEEVR